jgi:GDP-D-mannose dehydratase
VFEGSESFASLADTSVLYHALATARVTKSAEEVEAMRYSSLIASNAHVQVMRSTAPGMMEYELEARFRYEQAHLVIQLPRTLLLLDTFRPEVIINFAALCEVGQSWNHALDYYETNLMSLVRLTNELAKRSWFKRFVQVGSSEVYGSVEEAATEDSPVRPSSPYAASKAAFDFHRAVEHGIVTRRVELRQTLRVRLDRAFEFLWTDL